MEFSAYYGQLWHNDFTENHRLFFTISVPKINIEQAKKILAQSRILQTNDVIQSINKFNTPSKKSPSSIRWRWIALDKIFSWVYNYNYYGSKIWYK